MLPFNVIFLSDTISWKYSTSSQYNLGVRRKLFSSLKKKKKKKKNMYSW